MIHRALRRQPRDRRQHAVGVGRQHHDVVRMAGAAGELGVVDEGDRIGAAGVLGERGVVEIERRASRDR